MDNSMYISPHNPPTIKEIWIDVYLPYPDLIHQQTVLLDSLPAAHSNEWEGCESERDVKENTQNIVFV